MSEVKQVKVDNWGIYFLQRLKHFFNRTDYCDLTLQFQDNAQLKVHRLVLSACTEYFELLERTCEMYEDCLVMPDDLQADVVVPIINFMYTGQLEFKMELLEKLYQTSLVMNMPVLTKLLASHRHQESQQPRQQVLNNYYGKRYLKTIPTGNSSTNNKRSYTAAFENIDGQKPKRTQVTQKSDKSIKNGSQDNHNKQSTSSSTSSSKFPVISKNYTKDPRPTRYELPEELDEDNIFDNSFMNISYGSKPLMVHPETSKQYSSKRIKLFEEGNNSRFVRGTSSSEIVECKKISPTNNSLFIDDPMDNVGDENNSYHQTVEVKENSKGSSQLFDQIVDNDSSDITIETKNSKQSANLDHAKIISEVLKKYPHLVKGNKNIKLKILNTSNKSKKSNKSSLSEDRDVKVKAEVPDFTYETDVINSKEAARLIALGAENVKGPWICLICGTPGKALHFTTYFNFRKHLVEIHNEKPVPNICEYCGLKSTKRNYLVHHQLTKHNVQPPSHYNFPKCNYCNYVALSEVLLVKHKLSHQTFKRNTGFSSNLIDYPATFKKTSSSKYGLDKKQSLQCIYCLRIFLREANLYAHLKIHHKIAATNDGLIEDSDEELQDEEEEKSKLKHNSDDTSNYIKVEVPYPFETPFDDNNIQYQIERRSDGNIHVVSKKPPASAPVAKHKILNPGYIVQEQSTSTPSISKPQKPKATYSVPIKKNEFLQEMCESPPSNSNSEEIVVIDNNEYIVQDFKLIPKSEKSVEYVMTTTLNTNKDETVQTVIPTTSVEYHNIQTANPETKMFVKKTVNTNQPIQIVVSNEEEYKALMSNQSVIFKDANTDKGMTVLTQEASTIETDAIDMDNTQNNDMMIIQDDYGLNVTDAVAANNPNIVVVYSHPVEDQNKQFQIITTQGVGTQFIPSSAIITQNFETVSTCTPVVTANTNIASSWQNIQTNVDKMPIAANSELHTMTVAESVTIAPETISNSNVQQYAEVPLQTNTSLPININQIVVSQNNMVQNSYPVTEMVASIPVEINEIPVCQQNTMIALEHATVITNSHQQPTLEPQIQQTISTSNLIQSTAVDIAEEAMDTIEPPITTTTIIPNSVSNEEMQENNSGTVFVEQILEQPKQEICTAGNESVIKSLIGENGQILSLPTVVNTPVDNIIQQENIVKQDGPVNKGQALEDLEMTGTSLGQIEEHTENITVPIEINQEKLAKTDMITEESPEQNLIEKPVIKVKENQSDQIAENEIEQLVENPTVELAENPIETLSSNPLEQMEKNQIDTLSENRLKPGEENSVEEVVEKSEEKLAENPTSKVAVVQIENLASEWSEDESDSAADVESKTPKPVSDQNYREEAELEESIENIQQEVEKHVSARNSVDEDTILTKNVDLENKEDPQNNTQVKEVQASKEKITSLLNDWDDNDSQEDSPSTVENKEDDSDKISQNNEVVEEKSELNKSDNIRSLVSDWDEDEEENKD